MGIISVTCFFSVPLLNYAYNGRKYPAFISLIHVLRDDQRVLQVIIINVGNNSISNLFKLMIFKLLKSIFSEIIWFRLQIVACSGGRWIGRSPFENWDMS